MNNKNDRTLLLVEDEAIIAMNNRITLEQYGWNVLCAVDGNEAVSTVKNTPIDLILLDIDLGAGKIDGVETATIILKDFDIPIIFLTSHTEPEIMKKTEQVTSYGYIVKGTSSAVLDITVRTALKLFESKTERIRTESELEQTRRMLNDVLNTIPLRVFWKDLDSVYMGCNRLFAEDSGKEKPDEIIGISDFDIRQPEQAEANRLEDRKIIDSGISRLKHEEPFLTKDGSKNWITTSKIPLRSSEGEIYGILGMYEDITLRKKMENEVVFQKNRLANILYGSNVGTWEWNVQVGENLVNEHWVSIIGYTLDELTVTDINSWKKFVHPDDLTKVNELLEKHFNNELDYFECEFRMKHRDGHWVWILSRGRVASWTEDDKPLLVSGTHLDVNERRLAEDEISRQLSEKETILKEVHHRIKNNFSSIGSLLSLQADALGNKEAIAALQDAIGRVQSMRVLYEKLLLAEDYRNASIKNYLEDLVDEIVNVFPEQFDVVVKKQICDCKIEPDKLFLLGIIVNELFTNVMKYAFSGKDSGVIHISLSGDGEQMILVIHDNGIGLPDDFDLTKNQGFGLMLIEILTQQLNGEFFIEDSVGTKSTLLFSTYSKS